MIRYILVGGYVRKAADGGKAFCEELIRGFVEPVKVLDCVFAEARENWASTLAKDQELFERYMSGRAELQLADPENFMQQVKWADAIFLRGGENWRLMEALEKHPGWADHLDGKTLAGTSAGACIMSKYFYELDNAAGVGEGLGIVPVKVLVHYRSDYNAPNINWDKAYAELKGYKEDLPVLALAEGEFKVV